MKKLLYILILLVSFSGIAQNETLFEQGKELYKNGKYQQAINSWMKILDNGEHSAELYFNLGNAQYKLNHIGPSIYYYEKALQLSRTTRTLKTTLPLQKMRASIPLNLCHRRSFQNGIIVFPAFLLLKDGRF